MQVKIKKLHPDAVIPQYATSGSACFDLSSFGPSEIHLSDERAAIYGTGLTFEIPQDHVMLVFSRSGHGFKEAVRLSNCVGVIDSDYRGEVKVSLRSDGDTCIQTLHPSGTRIAQAMILPVQQVSFLEVDELGTTERGTGGLGSTGSGSLTSPEDDKWGPWVEWDGCGINPVPGFEPLQVRFRDGEVYGTGTGLGFSWAHDQSAGDIVAYRVKKAT